MTLDYGNWQHLLLALLPELVLTGWSLLVLLVVAWRHATPADARLAGWLTLAGFGGTAAAVVWLWQADPTPLGLPHMITVDAFRFSADLLLLAAGALTVLLSIDYLEREDIAVAEFYVLLIFAVLGMMFMAGAEDLIVVFLGIELLSISVYVLSAFHRRNPASAEAGFKYFLLGAFASGFLVYGVALIYGATGTTNLGLIGAEIAGTALQGNLLLAVGAGLLLIGFGFKVAAVPFHMWAPDVYDGAPTPVTAFMAAAVKAAAFVALFRIVLEALGPAVAGWPDLLWWLAVVTMAVGNLIALAQRSLKRMLAYSSVAHAGYLLAATVPGNTQGAGALLFYLAAYTLMTVAAFTVLIARGRGGERDVKIDDLAGLRRRHPWLAFGMAVAMLSLLGFPGTAGFMGKWYILQAAVAHEQTLLAIILVLASVVSAGYYLPVIMVMYMQPEPAEGTHAHVRLPSASRTVLAVATVLTLYLGVWPGPALDLARTSAESVGRGGGSGEGGGSDVGRAPVPVRPHRTIDRAGGVLLPPPSSLQPARMDGR